ncbi:hypothetical protein GCM10017624_29230 [Azotobacter vinelandii]|nr:hypothetical protein GCM10017624_29230 [Azotobacter vinelandii]
MLAAVQGADRIALVAEIALQQGAQVLLVVDHQNSRQGFAHLRFSRRLPCEGDAGAVLAARSIHDKGLQMRPSLTDCHGLPAAGNASLTAGADSGSRRQPAASSREEPIP